MKQCDIPDCDKPARSPIAELCKMHYHRKYRHGNVNTTARGKINYTRKYKRIYVPGHELADRNGHAYEHRIVLYQRIGPGPHPCHWCGTQLEWKTENRYEGLCVDHLNAEGDDNRPDNLVPACRGCNTARAIQKRSRELNAQGWFSAHDTVARTGGGRRPPIEGRPDAS